MTKKKTQEVEVLRVVINNGEIIIGEHMYTPEEAADLVDTLQRIPDELMPRKLNYMDKIMEAIRIAVKQRGELKAKEEAESGCDTTDAEVNEYVNRIADKVVSKLTQILADLVKNSKKGE